MERRKLFLRIDQMLQGSFSLNELNLLFIFQLDCPGLYSYGIPQANALHRQFHDQGLNVLGLSTAYDNPAFNSARNTRLLLLNRLGSPVGSSLWEQDAGLQSIDFPVGFDYLVSQDAFETEYLPEFWDHQQWSFCQNKVRLRAEERPEIRAFIRRFERVPLTFLFNVFVGVPGWVLFDRHLNIIHRWYGCQPLPETQLLVAHWLETQPQAKPAYRPSSPVSW
ncbi:hypothetical protein ACO2Q8_12545 [Larkinella sp. VNQ87]|uniref:hypothetical protein n=1 Tax=Larkinella sp. VNQ87 TaxID=3400921 RepID=UPI003BFF14C1